MKVTQKNVRVFHIEIDEEEAFLDYFRKNSLLLKEFFLLIEGTITPKIGFVLDQSGVCYKEINGTNIRLGGIKKEMPAHQESSLEPIALVQEPQNRQKLKVFDRTIRSGEEIHESLPLIIFGRINDGAKVFCEESMSVYGVIDGLVQCDGEYIVLQGITPRGHLIFNGEIIDHGKVKENRLQKMMIRNGMLEIKDIA